MRYLKIKIIFFIISIIIILLSFLENGNAQSTPSRVDIAGIPPGTDGGTTSGSGGGGGGGGGGAGTRQGDTEKKPNFTIDKDLIEIQLIPGQTKTETLTIENTGDLTLNFDLNIIALQTFVSLSEYTFSLLPKNLKTIAINFLVGEDERASVRTGKIILNTDGLIKAVNIILNILGESLFDLQSALEDNTLTKHQKIQSKIKMIDVSNLGKVNVLLEYFIKDFSDNEIKLAQENVEVSGSLIIERAFSIPSELKKGEDYLFYVKLSYSDGIAISKNPFRIVGFPFLIIFLLIFFVVFLLIIFIFKKKKKLKKKK